MHALIATAFLVAGSPGTPTSKDALALVKRTEALIARLGDRSALAAQYADEQAVVRWLRHEASFPTDAELKDDAAALLASRDEVTEVPSDFQATHALAVLGAGHGTVRILDGGGNALDFTWVRSGGGSQRLLLLAPPMLHRQTQEELLREAALGGGLLSAAHSVVQYYVRSGKGVWTPERIPAIAAPPAASAKPCQELLEDLALQVYVRQHAYRSDYDAFTTDRAKLKLDERALVGTQVTIVSADERTFVAEVGAHGGVVRIDERRKLVELQPCRDPTAR